MASDSIANAVKAYGAQPGLHGVSVDIPDGSFVVLVGPSGCGKSTLLRMIAGLEAITGGTIRIDGTVVNDLPPKQRDISMVFQNYALYPHMTVAENMAFSLTLAGALKADKAREVARAADILGLTPLLARYPKQLSGGQRQRVAMGRAIVRNPKVFLFDEPLSNLDAKLRVAMRAEIKALHQRLKTTTIYVTHDQVEAMTMADTIVVMHDGRVEQTGSPLQLYDQPANAFVATFIGSPAMNLIEGKVAAGGVVDRDGQRWPLPSQKTWPDGRAVMLGIRPEDISFVEAGTVGDVQLVEPTGAETLVSLSVGTSRLLVATRDRRPIKTGDRIEFALDPARLHVFDALDGQRL